MTHQDYSEDGDLLFGRAGSADEGLTPEASKEMRRLAEHLGADSDFYPGDFEAGSLLGRINQAIDAAEEKKIYRVPWLRFAAAAAAVALLMGTTMIGYFNRRSAGEQPTGNAGDIVSYGFDNSDMLASALDETYQPLDENAINLLLQDYTSGASHTSDANLLNDLTQEELDYLQKNFDVGEIL